MNRLTNNPSAGSFRVTGNGVGPGGNPLAVHVDAGGCPIPSTATDWTIQSTNLNIRPLQTQSDSAGITAVNLDIRNLSGSTDAIVLSYESSATNSASAPVGLLTPVYFLPTAVGSMRQNTFVVVNKALLSLSVRINLQIAPVNSDSYYVNDGSSFDLIGGGIQAFSPTKLMKFARIRVVALLSTATVEVYYFGRT